jgi:hypothetical protein
MTPKHFSKLLVSTMLVMRQRILRSFTLAPQIPEIEALFQLIRPKKTGHGLIRIGPSSDGGYLVPDDIDGIAAVLSPGVGEESRFELFFAERGVPCYLIDASVDRPRSEHHNLYFQQEWLSLARRPGHIDLDSWVDSLEIQGDLLLQMDIEGMEKEVLLAVSDAVLSRFRIVVVELHGLHRLLTKEGFSTFGALFTRLQRVFDVVHLHPNNCCPSVKLGTLKIPDVVELTLLRRDRVSDAEVVWAEVPHPLDRPNNPGREAVVAWLS